MQHRGESRPPTDDHVGLGAFLLFTARDLRKNVGLVLNSKLLLNKATALLVVRARRIAGGGIIIIIIVVAFCLSRDRFPEGTSKAPRRQMLITQRRARTASGLQFPLALRAALALL